jgi:uncharacterized protein (DUF1501 family)
MQPPLLTTRRDFLRSTLLGGALSWTVPSFVANTFSALHAAADGALTQVSTGKDGPILVLIQLAGGNDGLNAVIPYTNDFYYQARPTLGVKAADVLKLSDTLGFNPALAGFKSLYDAGHMAVLNGVGYPNPNRSHFRSTEIWQTASDEDRYLTDGWIGRYFDNACVGCDPTVGINIGDRLPQAFSSHNPTGVSLQNPAGYRFMGAGLNDDEEAAYRSMYNGAADDGHGAGNAGGSVSMLSGTVTLNSGQSALDFLERTSMDAQVSSDKIRDIAGKVKNVATYPHSGLANNLQLVARLIAGGLPTRVFYISQGGYDTHTNQRGAQDARLKELAERGQGLHRRPDRARRVSARDDDDLQRIRPPPDRKRRSRHRPRRGRADVHHWRRQTPERTRRRASQPRPGRPGGRRHQVRHRLSQRLRHAAAGLAENAVRVDPRPPVQYGAVDWVSSLPM